MKFCVVMGSPRMEGNTAELCKPFMERLRELGHSVEYITLADKSIAPCKGCYTCQDVEGRYGCCISDDAEAVLMAMAASDCIVLATPIYSWYCTANMKALIDRHYGMNKFYGTVPRSTLWPGKSLALITTYGYGDVYANEPFEHGMKRLAEHNSWSYLGRYGVRDLVSLEDFKTDRAKAGAVDFADRLSEALAGSGCRDVCKAGGCCGQDEDVSRGQVGNRRVFVIDGNEFEDSEGFYRVIDRLFTKDLDFRTGHNLDALNDVLSGGFGVVSPGEPIAIKWLSYAKSRRELGPLADRIIQVMEDSSSGRDCVVNTKA